MTVMAAEAASGAAEAGAAEASAGARQSVRAARAVPAARAPRQQPGGSQRRSQGRSSRTVRQVVKPQKISRTNYQTVVLAEFVAAILLVAATPFASKGKKGLSPYVATDLIQLVAITITYFLLALLSGTNPKAGRFSAWFGFLILLTVGLGEAARLAKFTQVFGGPPGAGAPVAGAGAGHGKR